MNQHNNISIGLLLFPGLTQLDLTGPYEVFARAPNTQVHLIWKDIAPIMSDRGLILYANTTFQTCPQLDVLCIPGGPGQIALMDDQETLAFIQTQAEHAQYISSVCTGSLVLGAAGLLKGYQATCHWASLDQLALLGATPVAERVVQDRNRITGAGITSGIDFALQLVALLYGKTVAQSIQLHMEYDPHPPLQSGTPDLAPPDILAFAQQQMTDLIQMRKIATLKAAEKLD